MKTTYFATKLSNIYQTFKKHVSRVHKRNERPCLACVKCGIQPLPYLDLTISMDQHRLFKPMKQGKYGGGNGS